MKMIQNQKQYLSVDRNSDAQYPIIEDNNMQDYGYGFLPTVPRHATIKKPVIFNFKPRDNHWMRRFVMNNGKVNKG